MLSRDSLSEHGETHSGILIKTQRRPEPMTAFVGNVPVTTGDYVAFPPVTLQTEAGAVRDLVAEGWTNWRAAWRNRTGLTVPLAVDTTQAGVGTVMVIADEDASAQMEGFGFWDVQAERLGDVETWVRGTTVGVRGVA